MSLSLALLICGAYMAVLFVLAYLSDRRARLAGVRGRIPAWVFTLSISVYCTSWTFYGSVGLASRSGLEFTAIYLGPTLIFLGWWFFMRKIVRITKQQRLTSIADFISARFGKSSRVAFVATAIALMAATPYVALQLKAVAQSFDLISGRSPTAGILWHDTAFWVAGAMALFAVLFGARSGSADEHYPGVITAIAFEAVVKLLALLAVGIFVLIQLQGIEWTQRIAEADLQRITALPDAAGARWFTLLFLSAIAVVCLPRQFQVTMVEAVDEGHFRTASWLFPLYLLLISAFVVPIAIAGYVFIGADANPDQFVLTVPLHFDNQAMAILAFIGGFSSATSMVIVSSIALSIMMSNHMLVPLIFRVAGERGRALVGKRLLQVRQAAILFVLLFAFIYYRTAGQSDALAAMGLIAFVGVAQFFPAMVLGLFWRQAAERGTFWALLGGLGMWVYTLLLPTLFADSPWVVEGPLGMPILRPQALLGAQDLDPVVHAVLWSLSLNTLLLILISLFARRSPLEQLQERLFVDVYQQNTLAESRVWRRSAAIGDLQILANQVLGRTAAKRLFGQTGGSDSRQAASTLISSVEQELAASIGAASARTLVSRVSQGESLSVDDMAAILDQTQQAVGYAKQLEEKSTQLETTARSLRQALVQLRRLDRFKDDFLSQISHELRTPMTSLKAFAEILVEDSKDDGEAALKPAQRGEYLSIIAKESDRLTGLLDELLDVQKTTRATRQDAMRPVSISAAVGDALLTFALPQDQGRLVVRRDPKLDDFKVVASKSRLTQVFINLISNALKYGQNDQVRITIEAAQVGQEIHLTVADNGPGIPAELRENVFDRFTRTTDADQIAGTGLGLAICRQILMAMGGSIDLAAPAHGGACFKICLQAA